MMFSISSLTETIGLSADAGDALSGALACGFAVHPASATSTATDATSVRREPISPILTLGPRGASEVFLKVFSDEWVRRWRVSWCGHIKDSHEAIGRNGRSPFP